MITRRGFIPIVGVTAGMGVFAYLGVDCIDEDFERLEGIRREHVEEQFAQQYRPIIKEDGYAPFSSWESHLESVPADNQVEQKLEVIAQRLRTVADIVTNAKRNPVDPLEFDLNEVEKEVLLQGEEDEPLSREEQKYLRSIVQGRDIFQDRTIDSIAQNTDPLSDQSIDARTYMDSVLNNLHGQGAPEQFRRGIFSFRDKNIQTMVALAYQAGVNNSKLYARDMQDDLRTAAAYLFMIAAVTSIPDEGLREKAIAYVKDFRNELVEEALCNNYRNELRDAVNAKGESAAAQITDDRLRYEATAPDQKAAIHTYVAKHPTNPKINAFGILVAEAVLDTAPNPKQAYEKVLSANSVSELGVDDYAARQVQNLTTLLWNRSGALRNVAPKAANLLEQSSDLSLKSNYVPIQSQLHPMRANLR